LIHFYKRNNARLIRINYECQTYSRSERCLRFGHVPEEAGEEGAEAEPEKGAE